MAANKVETRSPVVDLSWQSRTNLYYGRSTQKLLGGTDHRWTNFARIGRYFRLFFVGAILVVVGGIFPILISYEFCFKRLLNIGCQQCLIIDAKPYFEFDYIFATIIGVFGVMMPIFVVVIIVKVLRDRILFHDLFD